MFKNKKFEVKMVKDENPNESGQESLSPRQPLDRLDIEMLSREIAQDVATTYILIKGFKTICSILEHVVVTKVK